MAVTVQPGGVKHDVEEVYIEKVVYAHEYKTRIQWYANFQKGPNRSEFAKGLIYGKYHRL